MSFLYPQFLFAFGVLAIPLILHLFHLRKFKVFYFSSISFLQELDTTSKSTRNLRRLLVLIMRLLAFSALILAFAQPYFPEEITSVKTDRVRVVFIDNSQSMAAKGVEGELLSQAKTTALELVKKDKPGTRYFVFTNDFSAEELHPMSQPDAIDYLENIEYSAHSRSSEFIFRSIASSLSDAGMEGNVFVFSDAQKSQWSDPVQDSLALDVRFIRLAAQQVSNKSIDSVWLSTPVHRLNAPYEINVRIINHSDSDINSLPVKVKVNESEQQFTAEFNGKKETVLSLNYSATSPGYNEIRVEIDDEQLFFDDVMYATFNVRNEQSVGIINGEQATSNVSLVYELDAYYRLSTWGSNQILYQEVDKVDVLVVNEVKQVDRALSEGIKRLLDRGGVVVLIPSGKPDFSSWNELLAGLEMPVMQKKDSLTASLDKIHTHPFFDGVFDTKNPSIQIPVKRSSSLITSGSRSMPLLSYSDGSSFMNVSTKYGNRLFTFSPELNRSNRSLLNSDLFSALFLRIAEFSGGNAPLYLTAGIPSSYTVQTIKTTESPVRVSGNETGLIPRQDRNNEQTVLYFSGGDDEKSLRTGIYDLKQDETVIGRLAVNTNREESDPTVLSAEDLTVLATNSGLHSFKVSEISESEEIHRLEGQKDTELWRILLILALMFFMAEMAVLKFVK